MQGHTVLATDVDPKVIAALRNGKPTFYESGR